MGFSTIRVCDHCHSKNRIPVEHLADTGKCGNCKNALAPLNEPLDVDETAFKEILEKTTVPVLADFWASWCGPCIAAAPEVHQLAKEMAGKAVVLKVNTEENPALASRFRIQSIPNFIVFQHGQIKLQQAGFPGRAALRQALL